MPEPESSDLRWQVICSPANAEILHQLQRQASQSGRGEAVAIAFREIVRRLQLNPMDVGEPCYRLPALRMEVRTVVVPPLALDFAVCEDRPLVFIKIANLLSEPPS
jgi:hypothetical protein